MTSFKKDRGNWWVKAPKEMEVETIWNNSQKLFKLIHNTDGWRTAVNKTVCNRNGDTNHDSRFSRIL